MLEGRGKFLVSLQDLDCLQLEKMHLRQWRILARPVLSTKCTAELKQLVGNLGRNLGSKRGKGLQCLNKYLTFLDLFYVFFLRVL